MHSSIKGLLLVFLVLGQVIATSAQQDITCPAAFQDPCGPWTWANQASWDDLCSGYAQCGAALQSPIDIPTASLECGTTCIRPTIVYGSQVNVDQFNIGETLAVVPDGNNFVLMDDVTYNLLWIEFRQPSEHSLNADFADFEAQFWHQSDEGAWLAIAVLYDVDDNEENVFFASFWDFLPAYTNCQCGNGRIDEGEECDDGPLNSNTQSDRCRLDCTNPICGDGVMDRGEECDRGAANNDTIASTGTNDASKACRSNCHLAYCGDGVVDFGEDCDDGGAFSNDGSLNDMCSNDCKTDCGNGIVEVGEECDDGDQNSNTAANACRTTCTLFRCGDGVIDSNEQCDSGNSNSNTLSGRCRTTCEVPSCGDGVRDQTAGTINGFSWTAEQCDAGILLPTATCTSQCETQSLPFCGDGSVDPGEECDTGNSNSDTIANRCRTDCVLPSCGDGLRDTTANINGVSYNFGEECDAGPFGSRTCNTFCEESCGLIEVTNSLEECDLGGGLNEPNHGNDPNQCREGCFLPFCGDGIQDSFNNASQKEECDAGMNNGAATSDCTTQCTLKFCGDGVVDSLVTSRRAETCDDGNTQSDDGCSSVCQIECGDGFTTGDEECDCGDENANLADQCRTNCTLPACGDGIVDSLEECDYGAIGEIAGVTCRLNCKDPYCGDGTLDELFGEECDNGEGNDDLQVGGCSTRCTQNDCAYVNAGTAGDLNRAMACNGCFYSYMGSATRPPCVGGVHWLVAQQVQKISQQQIDQFTKIWGEGSNRRSQQGTCELSNRYNDRDCECMSQVGTFASTERTACSPVPRKPVLQTIFDTLGNSTDEVVLNNALDRLISVIARDPLILPTYYSAGTTGSSVIACETEQFYTRAITDLNEAVSILRATNFQHSSTNALALDQLIFLEYTLQFLESLQVLTSVRSPTDTLTNALGNMLGSGAHSPFLAYNMPTPEINKQTIQANVASENPLLIQKSAWGLQARLFRGAVAYNVDPEIHRFSNIPEETVWYVRFVQIEYLRHYGFTQNAGVVAFNVAEERVILENALSNMWNYSPSM